MKFVYSSSESKKCKEMINVSCLFITGVMVESEVLDFLLLQLPCSEWFCDLKTAVAGAQAVGTTHAKAPVIKS